MSTDDRDVKLNVPAQPGYLVLARLALSAICRLTPLEHSEVADLKLAITEAAARFVVDDKNSDGVLAFSFRLSDDRLELELRGTPVGLGGEDETVSRAIVEATVDEALLQPDGALLVKMLPA